ncbi:nuclear transport factor 2 family protein [Chitinophaga sp. Hz27]|uniref:nuclear transport factor 2 family protein n=1 Tax=Chitinophaga sp. Hz27 TaxID=3347169 RepID=UPI0035D9E6E0
MESTQKQQVRALLKAIETGAAEPVQCINPQHYKQHNLSAADGLSGFGELLQQLPPNSAKVDTVRLFEDADYVFAHTVYDFFGPKIGFDIFRFEDGFITEHWDNLQKTPSLANPSGHTMTDGSTEVKDLDKTSTNKDLVKHFVEDVLVNGTMNKLPQYFDGDTYIQHNPGIPDNLSGLQRAMSDWANHGVTMHYDRIHKVLGEGNFVLVVSEGNMDSFHSAFFDLFRVENGKIAEHWDTIQDIPAKNFWKNDNGKF